MVMVMAVSKKHRHLSPEVIYDFVKGGLDRQHLEAVQAHAGVCARCAALVARGRLILKWLRTWSIDAQNLAYGRVLLRDSLVRASTGVAAGRISRRLMDWRRNAPARYSAQFSLAVAHAGRIERASVKDLALLPEKAPGLRVRAGVPRGASAGREVPGLAAAKRGRPGERRPELCIEVAGKNRIVIRGEFDLGDSPEPLVLVVACRHRAEPQLKTMRRARGSRNRFEASFAGLAPGRYILALEPAQGWLTPSRGRNSGSARPK